MSRRPGAHESRHRVPHRREYSASLTRNELRKQIVAAAFYSFLFAGAV